jgi:hypothetical protein
MDSMKEAITKFSDPDAKKSVTDVISGVRSLGKGFAQLGDAVRSCDQKLEGRERALFSEICTYFQEKSYTDAAATATSNVMVNGIDIYRELDAAFTAYLAK